MFVVKDANGTITGLSLSQSDGTVPADPNDPRLKEFLALADPSLSPSAQLEALDVGSVRILEDVIDLLIDKGTILFTDLPEAAQQRLLERKILRRLVRQEKGLPDNDGEFLLSEDKIF